MSIRIDLCQVFCVGGNRLIVVRLITLYYVALLTYLRPNNSISPLIGWKQVRHQVIICECLIHKIVLNHKLHSYCSAIILQIYKDSIVLMYRNVLNGTDAK